MFNLFSPFGATTANFNRASQPWQLGFQADAYTLYGISLLFVLFCIVIFSTNKTYAEKYGKQINMISNVLFCIGIFCIFLLVSIYIGDDPIHCAGPYSEELEARKAASKGLTRNYQAAMTAWSAFATVFSTVVIKAKMKPSVAAGVWSGGMVGGTGATYGLLKTANASQLENISSQKFHPAAPASITTPSSTTTLSPTSTFSPATTPPSAPTCTPSSDNASGSNTQSLGGHQYNIPSPNEQEDGSLMWDILLKILPDWMKEDIASRLPSYPNTGTYHILFMQYNIFVYIMCLAFLFMCFCIGLIYMLTCIKNNREYIIEKVLPTFIGKLVPSKSVLGAMITVNKASLLLYVVSFGFGLFFLYINPLPADLGTVCDKAPLFSSPLSGAYKFIINTPSFA